MKFQEWMTFKLKLSQASISKYCQVVEKTLSRIAVENGITNGSILEIVTFEEFENVKKKLMSLEEFVALNARGNHMYSAALNKYSSFMEENYYEFQRDLEMFSEESGNEKENTSIMALIKARLGQGAFRQDLIYKWKGCSVTGINDYALLIASHVKPWRDSNNRERLDAENGLLLVPNLDKCFDKGYVSFDDYGKILMWSQKKDVFEQLGVNEKMKLRSTTSELKSYMIYHRENVFFG